MNKLIPVSLAILYRENKFLMQLRDDIPGILYPGCWGLFGGHIEMGEEPETALKRELIEEIGYQVSQPIKFDCYADETIIRYIYHAPLTVGVEKLMLQEGWDLGLLTAQEIDRGTAYSTKAEKSMPLGKIHRKILLDFLQAKT
jgi:8-oxo-dGTP pyrophosphatase MutT (NUDIX family)